MSDHHPQNLDPKAMRVLFIEQLSVLYAAKNHLTESLPLLVKHASFRLLKQALAEVEAETKLQMGSLQQIFKDMKESATSENCLGMNKIIEEAHRQITYHSDKKFESDMSIIFYMGVIENLQIGACRMLNLVATKKGFKKYAQLVRETLDMNQDNALLFNSVGAQYLGGD